MRGLYPDEWGLDVIDRHTRGLAALAAAADPATPVPTCGDWTMADLTFHLYEVQHFWANTIEKRPAGPEAYDRPERPADDALPQALNGVTERLQQALDGLDPGAHAWSWSTEPSDHNIAFTLRRQSHEAAMHHIDAAIAVKAAIPEVAPKLAADGLDELIDLMLAGVPAWATFTPGEHIARVRATDTDDEWTFRIGHISGTSTDTGTTYDALPAAELVSGDFEPTATVRGPALDMLRWMWGRGGLDRWDVTGDPATTAAVRDLVIAATQ